MIENAGVVFLQKSGGGKDERDCYGSSRNLIAQNGKQIKGNFKSRGIKVMEIYPLVMSK